MKKRRNATAQKTLDDADAKRRGRGDGPTDDGGGRRRGGGGRAADIMGRVRPPDRLTDLYMYSCFVDLAPPPPQPTSSVVAG